MIRIAATCLAVGARLAVHTVLAGVAPLAVFAPVGLSGLATVPFAAAGPALAVPSGGRLPGELPGEGATAVPHPSPGQARKPAVSCGQRRGNLASPGTAAPWAQQVLGFSDVWQFTTGQGENVAVIDSGVSGDPQLGGRVIPEQSLTGTSAGLDCVDHGTGVAGIIAAAPQPGNPFAGVAPGARILSIKVTDQDEVNGDLLAAGIVDAVNDHAQVINVSDQVGNSAVLSNAVRYAARRNVVIVAASGNTNQQTQSTGPFYPAEYGRDQAVYPNVLSVGAVDAAGAVPGYSSMVQTNVSVVAPGAGVLTIAPGGTFAQQDGTSFAAPFVAGVAALVRASHRNLPAAAVVSRIAATADGGTGAGTGGTGAGMVDPLQAVTAVLPVPGQGVTPAPSAAAVSMPRAPRPDRFTRMLVISVTGGAFAAAAVVVACAVVVPAARRRKAGTSTTGTSTGTSTTGTHAAGARSPSARSSGPAAGDWRA